MPESVPSSKQVPSSYASVHGRYELILFIISVASSADVELKRKHRLILVTNAIPLHVTSPT